jgi:RNA polymerase sigma-32 factor
VTTKTPTGDETAAAKPRPAKRKPAAAKAPRGAKAQRTNEEREEEEKPARASGEGDGEMETNDDGDDAVVGELAGDMGDDDGAADVRLALPKEPGLKRYDAFTAYLSEVQRHKLLTPDEEHELAVRYATTQDVKAAARMVTSNLRLVVKIAFEYRRAYRNLMDLIQEGNIGLMQAVKRYDPYRGVKLSSYAAWWIRAYILRFILNNWRLVKLGTTQTQRKLFFNLNKEKQRLISLGVDPTSAELSRQLDVPEHEVIEMDRRLSGADLSLDAPIGDGDGKPTTRMDLLPSSTARVDDTLAGAEIGDMVREQLEAFGATLVNKEASIFRDRLMSDEPATLQEIGDKYGISRERVRQIEKRLQDKLRVFLKANLGDAMDLGG